jgi:cytochrome c-type biogenesis protein CcmH
VVDFVVDRYGEYVLLKPRTGGSNLVLCMAGPIMLGAGLVMAGLYLRGRARMPEREVARLSEAEERRLREILDD